MRRWGSRCRRHQKSRALQETFLDVAVAQSTSFTAAACRHPTLSAAAHSEAGSLLMGRCDVSALTGSLFLRSVEIF